MFRDRWLITFVHNGCVCTRVRVGFCLFLAVVNLHDYSGDRTADLGGGNKMKRLQATHAVSVVERSRSTRGCLWAVTEAGGAVYLKLTPKISDF